MAVMAVMILVVDAIGSCSSAFCANRHSPVTPSSTIALCAESAPAPDTSSASTSIRQKIFFIPHFPPPKSDLLADAETIYEQAGGFMRMRVRYSPSGVSAGASLAALRLSMKAETLLNALGSISTMRSAVVTACASTGRMCAPVVGETIRKQTG